MKSAEFLTLSAGTMMLTALGIDIMLPVFGEVRKHFGLPDASTATAQIVTFFFLGQIAQILFGILSDRFGRLRILRIGFPLYIFAGIAATFAPSLPLMFAARFFAGMGASAVFMTTIAGIRDRFVGDQMARTLSLIFTIFLSTPVFAPFLGMAILHVASWRVVFLTPVLFSVIIFVWSLRLEESLPEERRVALDRKTLWPSFKKVLSNKIFLRYNAITTILFSGLSSWVASSEHIVSKIFGRPSLFPWVFAAIGLWMALSSFVNSKLSVRYSARKTIKWLLFAYTIVALALLCFTLTMGDPPPMLFFFVPVAMLLGINLAVEPNSSALAMEPMGEVAGLASAIYGTCFFFFGAGLGSVYSNLMKAHVLPIVIGFFGIGIIALMLAVGDRRSEDLGNADQKMPPD